MAVNCMLSSRSFRDMLDRSRVETHATSRNHSQIQLCCRVSLLILESSRKQLHLHCIYHLLYLYKCEEIVNNCFELLFFNIEVCMPKGPDYKLSLIWSTCLWACTVLVKAARDHSSGGEATGEKGQATEPKLVTYMDFQPHKLQNQSCSPSSPHVAETLRSSLGHRAKLSCWSFELSPLPSTAQVPALRVRVLSGCSQRHTRNRHIRGNGRRCSVTDSVAHVLKLYVRT